MITKVYINGVSTSLRILNMPLVEIFSIGVEFDTPEARDEFKKRFPRKMKITHNWVEWYNQKIQGFDKTPYTQTTITDADMSGEGLKIFFEEVKKEILKQNHNQVWVI